MTHRWIRLLLGIALAACGSDADPAPDDSAVATDGGEESPVQIPWLAVGQPTDFGPCPDGWRQVTGEAGELTCDAYPEGGPRSCDPGFAHFPGEPDCAAVGAACPADGVPVGLPADQPVVHVLSTATPGGDGTSASPYDTLSSFSWGALRSGTVVAARAGTYDGVVRIPSNVELRGACPTGTVLRTIAPEVREGVVNASGADARVADLSIAASPRPGLWASGRARSIVASGLVVEGAFGLGVSVTETATMELSDSVVRSTDGRGLRAFGGDGTVRRVVFDDNRELGVFSLGVPIPGGTPAGSLQVTDSLVRGTQPGAPGDGGRGASAEVGGILSVSRSVLMENHDQGVAISGDGTTAQLSDVVVHDTRAQPVDLDFGRGLAVQLGAAATVERTVFSLSEDLGVFVDEVGATAALSDVVIRDTRPQRSNQTGGRGLSVQRGAEVDLERVLLFRNRSEGIAVLDGLSGLSVTDVAVRATASRESDGRSGRGLHVQDGAHLPIRRALFADNREVGLILTFNTTGEASDVVIRGTRQAACETGVCAGRSAGSNLVVTSMSIMTLERFEIRGATLCGLQLTEDSELDIRRGVVADSAIGMCLQVDGYDVDRLTEDVAYRDNGENLVATTLPVPEPTLPAE